jgi:hypothetical protein
LRGQPVPNRGRRGKRDSATAFGGAIQEFPWQAVLGTSRRRQANSQRLDPRHGGRGSAKTGTRVDMVKNEFQYKERAEMQLALQNILLDIHKENEDVRERGAFAVESYIQAKWGHKEFRVNIKKVHLGAEI